MNGEFFKKNVKIKEICVYFLFFIIGFLILDTRFIFLTRSYEKKSSTFGDYITKWDVESSSRISSILAIFVMKFVKKAYSFGSYCLIEQTDKEQLCSFISALLILIWLRFEKTEKNNVTSDLCVLNLHIGKDITSSTLNIVSNNLCRQ